MIPNSDKITLAVDKDKGTAVIWDGNHRLTCASNLRKCDYPDYVRIKIIFMSLDSIRNYKGEQPKLPNLPKSWPTWLCGCHLGFTTVANG